MADYTDTLIKDYEPELRNHWVKLLNLKPWRWLWLAQNKWRCPNNADNRNILSAEDWEKEKELFISLGRNVRVDPEAEIVSTYHKDDKKNYLVWLKFFDTAGKKHYIDVWLSELDSKGNKNAEKYIDPRSPLCKDIYEMIITKGYIPTDLAVLLKGIGSKIWDKSTAEKVQYKLNSWKQQTIFEATLKKLNIDYKQLDDFDSYLYKGDPGNLCDYSIAFTAADDKTYNAKVDVKLLESNSKLSEQNPHNADILISTEIKTNKPAFLRVKGEADIENTTEFKQLLAEFSAALEQAGQIYIRINNINEETGKVDWEWLA